MFEEKFALESTSGTREFFDEDTESSASSHRDPSGSRQGAQGTGRSSMGSKRGSRPSGPARQGSASSSSLRPVATPPSREGGWTTPDLGDRRKGVPRDTHFYETEARFQKITVPIRIPMTVFDEDVGDVRAERGPQARF